MPSFDPLFDNCVDEILALDEKKEIHIVESHTIIGDEANKPTDWSKYNNPESNEDI